MVVFLARVGVGEARAPAGGVRLRAPQEEAHLAAQGRRLRVALSSPRVLERQFATDLELLCDKIIPIHDHFDHCFSGWMYLLGVRKVALP